MKRVLMMFLLIFLVTPLFACSYEPQKEGAIFAFDTAIDIKIRAKKEELNTHFDNICDIFFHYDALCNRYYSSEGNNVYTINNSKDFVSVDKDLIDLLEYALWVKEETNGHFNILVAEISDIYKEIIDYGEILPSYNELDKKLEEMNSSKIIISNDMVKIEGNAKIDLGAIAKGYALSKVKEYLIKNNIKYYLINAGSSSLALGDKDGEAFIVGIKYDENNVVYIKDLDLGCASINEQYTIINGEVYHHIVDPTTAKCAKNHESVYLIGENSAMIDAFCTAFMSMELDEIKKICEKYDLEYIIYDEGDVMYKSSEGQYYGKD